MRKIETGVSKKGCLSGVSGCVFSIWGFILNICITRWLMRTHYNFPILLAPKTLSTYLIIRSLTFLSSLLGLLLGFITGYICVSREWVLAWRSGWVFLVVVTGLSLVGLPIRWRLMFDTYAFSFLWALSLIAVGYVLRTRPKERNDVVSSI